MATRLLIDGYNLLHASNVFTPASGSQSFARTRQALLQFLAESLEERLRGHTTIVFDATQAPSGLTHEGAFAGMQVLFSRRGQDADALIEDLLEVERAPRELLVVSSDHRVQRAARQKGAKFIDSDVWCRDVEQAHAARQSVENSSDAVASQEAGDVADWLKVFDGINSRELEPVDLPPPPQHAAPEDVPTKAVKPRRKRRRSEPPPEKPSSGWNPFPPGYGEDVLGED